MRVKKPVRVSQGDSYCELLPEDGCVFEAEIDFQSGAIGHQAYQLDLLAENFDVDVAGARTFCMLHQVEAMHSAGLALGGSIQNAILVDGDVVMNEEGLRSPKEFVQHKLLDASREKAEKTRRYSAARILSVSERLTSSKASASRNSACKSLLCKA